MTQRWLAFDTSTEVLSIGVGVGDQVLLRTQAGGAQASASLIPTALQLLAQADVALQQLDAIVFGRGPGSFTGLRTACAVAQGLAFGADIPVLPVDTLLAVAEEAREKASLKAEVTAGVSAGVTHSALTVLALLDARMDEVYSAAFAWDGRLWQSKSALQVGPPQHVVLPSGDAVMLAGNAFEAYGERLPAAPRMQALPTAGALLRLAPALMAAGHAVPPEQALPLYLRDKVAQTTAEREAVRAAQATGA